MIRCLLCLMFIGRVTTEGSARFTQQPVDQVVVAGHRAILSCSLYNYSGIVQWTKDGLALGMGSGLPAWPRYRIVGDVENGVYDLEIQEAELSDDAVYECQATEVALRSDRASLTVLVPPEEPVIEGGPELLLQAETPYNLTCRVQGAKPAAGIVWYSAGVRQQGASSTHGLMDDGKREYTVSVLPFSPSELDIGRELSCRAQNDALPTGKESTVRLDVHHRPSVRLSIYPQKVREGDHVVFTCTVSANPAIQRYRWAKGGVLIEGAWASVYETAVDHSYFTEPVSCQVENTIGSTNVSSLLDVQFGPRIVEEPQMMTVDTGGSVTLNCVWVGNPPLTLTWTRKGSNMVLSNSNHLYLKSVTQADAGQYICKAIVPQIGVGEREVTLHVNGPPIISSEVVQYATEGARGRVECYIDSTPRPDRIAWTWRENVLEAGTFERYTVERTGDPEGVRSTLLISNVAQADFETLYNCTAWNGFGSGTALIQLLKEDVLPIGLIIGVTVSLGILLILGLAGLVVFLYRRRKRSRKDVTLGKPGVKADPNKEAPYLRKDLEEDDSNMSTATRVLKAMYSAYQEDMDMKPELRSDTLDTREDCELKDPTNGYYNVRGQEDRLPSRTLLYSEYGGGGGRYEGRPPSRLSHASGYGPVGGGAVAAPTAPGGGGGGGGGLLASCYSRLPEYGGGEGGAEAGSQLSFDAYAYPPCGLAPYGRPANLERLFDPPSAATTIAPKFPSASRFSYSSSQHSEHGRPYQQRMQTHV